MTVEKRRLSAILVTDVVGYTSLMEREEAGTWRQIKALRTDLLQPTVDANQGRIVKTTGDGLLAEFQSVIAAVGCARQVQTAMAERVRHDSLAAAILIRIGIDVGDVILDEDDVYGEAVNIAARLQSISPPGGFCLSRRAYENLGDRHLLTVEDIGECAVHNLSRPVPALIWRPVLDQQRSDGAVLPWRSAVLEVGRDAVAPRRRSAQPLPPERSSVAVLPFETAQEDPEQRYFADGLVEEVIAQLARFRSLFVISRLSTLAYRGATRDVREIGGELGVEYVVEGSVRRAGGRIRVGAQMIDVADGRHVWAERYDRTIEDIFTVQDEIAEAVVATVAGQVEADRLGKARRKPTENLQAYDLVLRGLSLHRSGIESYQRMADAVDFFRQAAELDPNYARAHAWRACAAARLWSSRRTPDELNRHFNECEAYCRRALELDPDDAEAHRVMGALLLLRRDYERAEQHVARALALNPSDAFIALKAGNFYCYAGRPDRAEPLIRRAMRLNPFHPDWYWFDLGLCRFVDGRVEEAVEDFHRATLDASEIRGAYRAACCALLEHVEEAAAYRCTLLAATPGFTIGAFMASQPFRDRAHAHRLRDGLIAAGFPT